jgi:hypothetical protein
MSTPWLQLAVAGVGGLSLGIGLMIGAFVVRMLRRYTREDTDDEQR